MRYAAAISEHPLATQATGEVVGQVLEAVGPAPDLAVLFVTSPHLGVIDDIASTVRALLAPTVLVGAGASSVIGGSLEVEDRPAISLWAGRVGPVTPVRLAAQRLATGWALTGLPDVDEGDESVLVVLADPFTFPADGVLDRLGDRAPGLRVVGGLASAARGPGGNRLVLDDAVVDHGAVGVLVDPAVVAATLVSQGARPVGRPFVVTRSEGNVIEDLAGMPALDRLREVVAALGPHEAALVGDGLHIGRVIDEARHEHGRGDFLVRAVTGADPESGSIAIGDRAEVGATVQFQVRDAASADEDLRLALAGREAEAALVFTCTARGMRLFGEADHDAALVHDRVGRGAVAGMFCAGELGPVGGRSFVHGHTASVLLWR